MMLILKGQRKMLDRDLRSDLHWWWDNNSLSITTPSRCKNKSLLISSLLKLSSFIFQNDKMQNMVELNVTSHTVETKDRYIRHSFS